MVQSRFYILEIKCILPFRLEILNSIGTNLVYFRTLLIVLLLYVYSIRRPRNAFYYLCHRPSVKRCGSVLLYSAEEEPLRAVRFHRERQDMIRKHIRLQNARDCLRSKYNFINVRYFTRSGYI